jgi:hypothetical protein
VPRIGVFTHVRPWEVFVIADLDTLLIALYVELTDRVIPHADTRVAAAQVVRWR